LITNLEDMCQVKERHNDGAWKDDVCNEECNVFRLPFIPWVPHGWEPYNIRRHKGHDDQWINNIPPFGLVDVKSLPTGNKDFLYKKTEHKGQYNPVWKRNKAISLLLCVKITKMVPVLGSFSMSCTCRKTRTKVKTKPITHGRNNKIKYNQLQDLALWAKKTLNGVNTTSGAWGNTGVRKLQLVRFSFESDWCKFLLVHMLIIECPNTSLSTVISSNLHFDKDYVKQES